MTQICRNTPTTSLKAGIGLKGLFVYVKYHDSHVVEGRGTRVWMLGAGGERGGRLELRDGPDLCLVHVVQQW